MTSHPRDVLSVDDLCKSYSGLVAVDHVSFVVGRNEIVGLLGPNGAGKTTIINSVLGVLAPTSGAIHIGGIDVARRRSLALAKTNFAAVYATLPGNLTVAQNLRVFGLIYGVRAALAANRRGARGVRSSASARYQVRVVVVRRADSRRAREGVC